MSELIATLRAALESREAENTRKIFDVGDLVACNSRLRDYGADEVNKLLHANMKALGIAPAGIGIGLWRFGRHVEPKRRSIGGR